MKAQRRSRGTAVPSINLGNSLGHVVNAKPLLLYSQEDPWYLLYRRLGGHRGQVDR
jgi:hypothetical protein